MERVDIDLCSCFLDFLVVKLKDICLLNILILQLLHLKSQLSSKFSCSKEFKLWFNFRLPGSLLLRAAEPRLVRLKRIDTELGVQICGGNVCGIFVEMLDDESPAKTPDGLLPGDLILEVKTGFINVCDV